MTATQATANYRRSQIDMVQKERSQDCYPAKIKVMASNGLGSNWMDVTPAEVEAIKAILTRIN